MNEFCIADLDDLAKVINDAELGGHDLVPEHNRLDAAAIDGDVVAELARLSPLEYDRARAGRAEQLGVRVAALDVAVKRARKGGDNGQGRKVESQEAEPWDKPVDGAKLLDEMSAAILQHIVVTQEQADTIALYSVFTHGYEVFKVAPRLGVRAPTRECGKSELLLRIQRFVPRALSTENLTGPVLFRLVEDQRPTLFVDELDNLLSDSKSELLGLFNSGYARNGKAYRLVGDSHELREFSTFCPLVYGMVGKPTDSFNSRSIPIEMRRATPTEWRALLSLEDGEEEDKRLLAMGRKAARWVSDNLDKLKSAKPDMGSMSNRPATNWKPLFAVAELAGGDWKGRARAAASAAAKLKQAPVDEEELFTVIKASFDASTKDYVESENLARKLAEVDGGPWAECGRTGKPITTNALARVLRPFGIGPGFVGPRDGRTRGYFRHQFEEVFASYVVTHAPTPENEVSKRAPVHNAMDIEQLELPKRAHQKSGARFDTPQKPNNDGLVHGCTVATPVMGGCARVEVTTAASPPTTPRLAPAEDPWYIPPEFDRRRWAADQRSRTRARAGGRQPG